MSNVSNRHSVIPFIAGETQPHSGQRLAKVGYKQTAKMTEQGIVAPKSIAVSVPPLNSADIQDHMEQLMPHIVEFLESKQDEVIRSLYEGRKYQLSDVTDDEIGIQAICNFMVSQSSGGRITKEYLESWFVKNVQDNLSVVIAEKLGTENLDDPRIGHHLNIYRTLIGGLSGKNLLNAGQIQGVKRAIEIAELYEGDDCVNYIESRLKMMEKKENELMLSL